MPAVKQKAGTLGILQPRIVFEPGLKRALQLRDLGPGSKGMIKEVLNIAIATALSSLPPAAAQAHPFPSAWCYHAASFETQQEVTVLDRMHFVLLENQ